MSKILLLGYNPPPFNKKAKIEASHYRTWQFLQPLLEDGHEIRFCAAVDQAQAGSLALPQGWEGKIAYQPIEYFKLGWRKKLQKVHDEFNPDCVIAVNFDMCLNATLLRTRRPVWMDIYGDYLTIVQAACYRAKSDRGIPTSISFVRKVLQKGDVFSVCSEVQKHALVGELAMAGRLNTRSFGYQFGEVVLPGALIEKDLPINPPGASIKTMTGPGGLKLREDSFIVLWCGGYNTWTDVDSLFAGLEWAMACNPSVHFVSVGASTYQSPDNVYELLFKKIDKSPYYERFHMLGWQPWEEIPAYYQLSDVGLNIDALHYETIYGTRTRLLEMIAAPIPVITSLGSELSYLLRDRGAALTFDVGDWRGLGEQIIRLAQDPLLRDEMRKKAFFYAKNELSFASTTARVRAWAQKPAFAPDKQPDLKQARLRRIEFQARAHVRQILWELFGLAQ